MWDGTYTLFLNEVWVGDIPLFIIFSKIYKHCVVINRIMDDDGLRIGIDGLEERERKPCFGSSSFT